MDPPVDFVVWVQFKNKNRWTYVPGNLFLTMTVYVELATIFGLVW